MKKSILVLLISCILAACGKSEKLNNTNYRTTPSGGGDNSLYANWDLGTATTASLVLSYQLRIDKGSVTHFVTCKLGSQSVTVYAQSKAEITGTEIHILEDAKSKEETIGTETCSASMTKMTYRYQLKSPQLLNLVDENFVSQDLKKL